MGPLTPEMKTAHAASARATSSTPSTGHARRVPATRSSSAASPPTWPPSSARARCAPTCWARATCSRRRRSSSRCAQLVHQAMEEGAVGVTTALIYAPEHLREDAGAHRARQRSRRAAAASTARTCAARATGLLEAVQETIDIASASGAPAEIYHLKVAGQAQLGQARRARSAPVDAARAAGMRITADMYVYTAGATGLDAAMPPWVQDGGLEAWIAAPEGPGDPRARDRRDARPERPPGRTCWRPPAPRARCCSPSRIRSLKPLTGKTLAEVAQLRGVSPEDAAIDLVIEDGSRVGVAYFLMSEDNVRRQVALPWVSFDSDADAPAPEGVFLKSSRHPRAYGNFARVLGQVRARRARASRWRRRSASSARCRPRPCRSARSRPSQDGLLRRRRGLRPAHHPGPRHLRAAAPARDRRRGRLGQRRARVA